MLTALAKCGSLLGTTLAKVPFPGSQIKMDGLRIYAMWQNLVEM